MDTESLRYELIRIDADQQITDGDKNWLLPERTQIALSNAAG
jgi:hypothetical protein